MLSKSNLPKIIGSRIAGKATLLPVESELFFEICNGYRAGTCVGADHGADNGTVRRNDTLVSLFVKGMYSVRVVAKNIAFQG